MQRHLRKIVTTAVRAILLILTIGGSASVGAAAPANVFTANGCPVGNYQCLGYYPYGPVAYGAVPYVSPYYAAGVVGGATYFDPRYCGDGRVSIVPDKDGHLINVCTSTGVRFIPVYVDGYPYVGPAYVVYR